MEVRIGIALREHTLFLGSLFSGMRSSLKLVDGVVTNKPSAHYTSICVTSLYADATFFVICSRLSLDMDAVCSFMCFSVWDDVRQRIYCFYFYSL
uniref:Uncharacterized protein n=1 Tax=Physcomitrium patens TaxID=3218 RepID=A0A2K1KZV5_PHYPA|nr:hypothetical protein PHYPA_002071 [Physcomitrium patens]